MKSASVVSTRKPYLTLLYCTATTLALTLLVYALITDRNPLNRIAYAVFVSTVPVIASIIAIKIRPSLRRWTVVVYASLFLVIIILLGVLRNV